jgi:hypothetical protein
MPKGKATAHRASMAVEVSITPVSFEECSIEQQQAWRRLWAWLLRFEPDENALDSHVSPVVACPECSRNLARCICAHRGATP